MAVTSTGSAQTSIVAALSSLRKSFGTSAKSAKTGAKRTAAKTKISAPTAAELRSAAAKKTLRTLQLGVTSRGYSYTPLPGSTVNRQI